MYYCFILGKNSIIIIFKKLLDGGYRYGIFQKIIWCSCCYRCCSRWSLLCKKRKDEKSFDTEFEDFDDEKIFDITKGSDKDGNAKVTIVFNSKKAKNVADKAADKVINATDKMKDTVTDKLGEDTVAAMKDKMDVAKDMIDEAATYAKDKAKDAKDIVVDKIGEENIEAAKDKIKDVASTAKDKVTETVDKYVKTSNDTDVSEDDFVDEDFDEDDFVDETVEPADDSKEESETEDDVNIDDMLEDELEDL